MIDTHCHLYAPPLGGQVDAVLHRARQAGVKALVVPGTTLQTSKAAVALAERYPEVHAAVGVHPEAAEADLPLAELERLAQHPRVVAIGEVGLDRGPGSPDLARQEHVLRTQIQLAQRLSLPLLLHSRDATGRLLRLLQDAAPAGPGGLLHAWAGAPEVAQELASLGFRFGVAGVVARPEARRVRARLSALPLSWLVLETDAPYIGTPQAHRGQVEPANLPEIRDALASLLGLSPARVAETTSATAARELGMGQSSIIR